MLITIIVARRHLDDVHDFLISDGLRKPSGYIWYSLMHDYTSFIEPQSVGVSLHEFRLLEDYQEENMKLRPHDIR